MKKIQLFIGLLSLGAGVAYAGGTIAPAPEESPAAPARMTTTPSPVIVAPAWSPFWYAGASVGWSGYNGTTRSGPFLIHPDSATGGKGFAGYQWTPNWGAEIAYANLGSTAFVRGEGEVIDLIGTLPFASGWRLFGKIGGADMRASGADHSGYKAGANYGIGITYMWSRAMGIRAEAERFQKVGPDLSGNLYSIGPQYNF